MAFIAGINLPSQKRIDVALTYIYGIGHNTAHKILNQVSIPGNTRVHKLDDSQISTLSEYIDKNHRVEGELRREVAINIKQMMDLGCYRGLRHRRRLPVNGQRTKTNAKTRKGKSSSPIAGKKKAGKK